jgi:hypothetical protein
MPKRAIDYSNTIFYKIVCNDTSVTDVYVGHTTNFVQRKYAHKIACNNSKSDSYNSKVYQVIRSNGGWDNWHIVIIDCIKCINLYEARKKEQEYFVLLNANLNSIEPLPQHKQTPTQFDSLSNQQNVMDITDCNLYRKKSETLKSKKNDDSCYKCSICDFVCCYKSNYETHLLTHKHQTMVQNEELLQGHACPADNTSDSVITDTTSNICKYCKKSYLHPAGLSRHKKTCSKIPINQPSTIRRDEYDKLLGLLQQISSSRDSMKNNSELPDSTSTDDNIKVSMTDFQNTVVNTTKCMKDMLLIMMTSTQLQNKMMEITKQNNEQPLSSLYSHSHFGVAHNSEHSTINNSIITTNSNNNNNTFNMNLFLNEKCKYAMNMKDFVNSIQLNLTDLENLGRLGYVEGMSNILIDNLKKTDVYKRPVHCSDVKRETLYVKDNNQWERDGPDHAKMTNAVLAVEQKNVALLNEWAKANPRCMNSDTRENDKYFKLSKAVTDGDADGNIAKVIHKVAKSVTIEKDRDASLQIEEP